MTADKGHPAGVHGAATAATATATTMPRPGLRWLRLKRAPWRTLMGQFFLVSTVLLLLSMAVQGAWIATDIKQDESALEASFRALDPEKVHFAVLGDFEPDAHVLVRRPRDLEYIRNVFALSPSTRFTFNRAVE